ncbi:MAG: FkbM family methyltransferase, partial [Candidatus Omnitrophica bacterium]|nr:FkbM family methyltransferase [Candidatus Omnitrophota bacterium]
RSGRTVPVEAVTLDNLIKIYGRPKFCKIDVEGHELSVLHGLSEPIKYIAFEFTPERKGEAVKCVDYLAAMGEAVFNYSPEESMKFHFKKWVSPREIKDYVASISVINGNVFNWGDIYVNFYRMY